MKTELTCLIGRGKMNARVFSGLLRLFYVRVGYFSRIKECCYIDVQSLGN